jgi:hypothetical protein
MREARSAQRPAMAGIESDMFAKSSFFLYGEVTPFANSRRESHVLAKAPFPPNFLVVIYC